MNSNGVYHRSLALCWLYTSSICSLRLFKLCQMAASGLRNIWRLGLVVLLHGAVETLTANVLINTTNLLLLGNAQLQQQLHDSGPTKIAVLKALKATPAGAPAISLPTSSKLPLMHFSKTKRALVAMVWAAAMPRDRRIKMSYMICCSLFCLLNAKIKSPRLHLSEVHIHRIIVYIYIYIIDVFPIPNSSVLASTDVNSFTINH